MRLIPRVSLRSVLRAAPACSSGAVFSEQERMEQWNSREGVGNRDAGRLLGILSSGLLSILIASLFPSLGVEMVLRDLRKGTGPARYARRVWADGEGMGRAAHLGMGHRGRRAEGIAVVVKLRQEGQGWLRGSSTVSPSAVAASLRAWSAEINVTGPKPSAWWLRLTSSATASC